MGWRRVSILSAILGIGALAFVCGFLGWDDGKRVVKVMSQHERLVYFGYGSNLRGTRLQVSAPSATFEGIGRLDGFKLAFTTPSRRWGGAAADVLEADGGIVYGAMWSIAKSELLAVDDQESVNEGQYFRDFQYVHELDRRFQSTGRKIKVLLYRVRDPEPNLIPSKLYLRVILAGAEEIGLPPNYINMLSQIETTPHDNETLYQLFTGHH
uniref:gamma-glutamylcyclotransferase n=1 Tax=Rhodosorus marinus TaxID=101924 RepID=A0A7S3A626_9RHOD|mmetsp:Transcript_44539/g.172709  ORF Transcript_44539/g.172709 Transcript_44539/m.172709 type:complete len:211 (+) Transcript_44539:135-767(+)